MAGNLVTDDDGGEVERRSPGFALAAVTSETPVGVAFRFGSLIGQARARAAEKAADRLEAEQERKRERRERFDDLPGSVSRATLEAIADCESGGDPRIVSSNGLYHGKYQFSTGAWEAVGGKGLPSQASEAEQDFRAALLYTRSGPGQWPVCGQ